MFQEMKRIHFNLSTSRHHGELQKQIAECIQAGLGNCPWSVGTGEYDPDSINVCMRVRDAGDVLVHYVTADRNLLWGRDDEGKRLINRFRLVLVPGQWLKQRLLKSPSIHLRPDQIHCVGSPRVDMLRRAGAEILPRPHAGHRLKVLWVPTSNKAASGATVSSNPGFECHLRELSGRFDVIPMPHPRNRKRKAPVVRELLEADVVISDTSSVIYEAWALGKPVIFPRWLVADKLLAEAPGSAEAHIYRSRIGLHADNFTDLVDILESGPRIGNDVHEFMDEYLENYRGGDACNNIAQLLASYANDYDLQAKLDYASEILEPPPPATPDKASDGPAPADIARAISTCEEILRYPQSSITVLRRTAGLLLLAGRPDLAECALREITERDWNDARNHRELGEVFKAQKKWWLVAESLTTATELDPNHAEWFFDLGDALERMGRHADAAAAFRAATHLAPDQKDFHYRLGYALELAGEAGQAQAAYQEAIRLDGGAEPARFGIGVFHQKRGLWEAALAAYERQLESSPLDGELHYRIGMAHDRLYRWQEASECYVTAISLDANVPRPEWHYRLGFVLERMQQWDRAADTYRAAIHLSRKHIPYWNYRLGYVLEKAGKLEAACKAYLRTKPSPELPPAKGLMLPGTAEDMAGSELLLHDREAAARYLSGFSAIEYVRRLMRDDMTRPEYHALLGELHERNSQWKQAAKAYAAAIDRSNDHPADLYYRLGYALYQSKDLGNACEAFRCTRILQRPHGVSEDNFNRNPELRATTSYVEYRECLPVRENVVLYESFHGKSMSCNPLAIFEKLVSDPEYGSYLHVWVLNDPSRVRPGIRYLENVIFVEKGSDAYHRYLATAKWLINNTGFTTYFIRRPEQKYLATWHGTPLKTLGKEEKYKFFDHRRMQRNFLQATHLVSPNRHTSTVLLDSYDIRHLFTGKIAETGYPRIDLTLNQSEESKSDLRSKLSVPHGKPVILYAPTWRGTLDAVKLDLDSIPKDLEAISSLGCHVLFRGHSLVEGLMSADKIPCTVVPANIDTNELLSIVDVLITDYSSIFFDFLATDRPIIFYTPDLEEYERERGLYFSMDDMPGPKCRSIVELIECLVKALASQPVIDQSLYQACRELYAPLEDGKATDRVISFFFGDSTDHVLSHHARNNRSVIFYGGSFQANGITASFINLLHALDRDSSDIVLAFSPGPVESHPERLSLFRRLPPGIYSVARCGNMAMTLEERRIRRSYENSQIPLLGEAEEILFRAYAREFTRIFGDKTFDVAIEFSGYDHFWSSILIGSGTPKRRIIYLHNDMYSEHVAKYPELRLMFDLYRHADALVSVSDMTCDHNRDNIAPKFVVDPSKFTYCDNPINPEEIIQKSALPFENGEDNRIFDSGSPVFVNIGRLSVEKDHEKLIRAFSIFRQEYPRARLVIIGFGPLEHHLKQVVKDLALSECVHIIGYRSNPYPYLKRSNCFVLSSNHEGQPMTLLEAIILGKPIIATDIVGNRSVLHDKPGLLVDNSIEGLVSGMKQYVSGNFPEGKFDWRSYQSNAIKSFYEKVVGIRV